MEIREVWAQNLEDEFAKIHDIVDDYPYVAMDVQHPGAVYRPLELNIKSMAYATIKANVDVLKLIQLGLTFSDEHGNMARVDPGEQPCAWQFNFRGFDTLGPTSFEADHIDLLRRSGIDFARHATDGVDAQLFAKLLMSSGVVINSDVHWVTFYGSYGVGYLLKLLTEKNLPDTMSGFFDLVKIYFPNMYDIKHMMRFCNGFDGGLNGLADILDVKSDRICHKAGSDSFLTARCFIKLVQAWFNGSAQKYGGVLFGLGAVSGE